MEATQQDIADRLGISRSLVSRALRGTAGSIRASPGTVRRIREAAAKLGYRPSVAALALRGEGTRTIGVLVKDFADPFFGQLLAELDRLARLAGFSLVMSGRGGAADGAGDSALLVRYRPDGLLLVGSDFLPQAARRVAAAGQPVVRLGSGARAAGIDTVAMDEAEGLARLVGHLAAQGHRCVGYLAVTGSRSRRREAAWRAAATAAGVAGEAVPEARWRDGAWARRQAEAGRTAWAAFDDLAAIRAVRAWRAAGVGVPRALALAGVDDIPAAALVTPALTTLRQPVHAMAQRAFALLTAPGRGREVRVAPELIVRESSVAHTAPAAGKGQA